MAMKTANRSRHEVIIVGGRVAGSATAILLADPVGAAESFYYEFPAAPHNQLANPVSTCARSIADQFLNAPTIIAAVDGKGMTRLTGIVSTTRDLGL
jgi:hypothetical protein